MAQIGTFTRSEDGTLRAPSAPLSLNVKARFIPAGLSLNGKAPDLRVLAGNVEIRAAWKRIRSLSRARLGSLCRRQIALLDLHVAEKTPAKRSAACCRWRRSQMRHLIFKNHRHSVFKR